MRDTLTFSLCAGINLEISYTLNMEFTEIINTPIGHVLVTGSGETITSVELPLADVKQQAVKASGTETGKRITEQLNRYFDKTEMDFNLELAMPGTDFQRQVWQCLRTIPCGAVMTYGELARQLGSSAQAVGNACRANPIPLIVPCHRVVSQSGLGGFSGQVEGYNIHIKQWLLEHEGVDVERLR